MHVQDYMEYVVQRRWEGKIKNTEIRIAGCK